MEASFELFGLTGHRLGLFAAAGMLLLLAVMLFLAGKRAIPAQNVCVLTLTGAVLGIVFARLLYCLVNLSDFIEAYENPWLMLRFFDGGLSIAGLLCGILLAVPVAAMLTGQKPAELLDLLCVPMGILFCALYLGQQDTGLGIGKVVEEGFATQNLPWLFLCERMGVNVEYRMLVYVYQAVFALLIALVMIPLYLFRQCKPGFQPGETGLLALALYGCCMVVLESLRDDGHMLVIFLRIGQVTAALLPIAALIVFCKRYVRYAGRKNAVCWLSSLLILLFIAGIALLEFALDGRLAMVEAGNGTYYAVMIALCGLVAAAVCLLYSSVQKLRKSKQ